MEGHTSLSTALVIESEPQGSIGRVEGRTNQDKKATERKGIIYDYNMIGNEST